MKANRNYKMTRDDRAEVGVGTLIVFIAMVLVAAVAAAVLINTSGTLQERAQATGKEATQEVSSNLKVASIYGERNSTGSADHLEIIKVYVELSAGAKPMDLTELIIRYSDGANAPVNLVHAAAPGNAEFDPSWIRGLGTGDVMQSGDLVELTFWVENAIEPRTDIEILLIPEFGTPVPANFKTPATYGTDATVTLR
jgi:flagellin FlaB